MCSSISIQKPLACNFTNESLDEPETTMKVVAFTTEWGCSQVAAMVGLHAAWSDRRPIANNIVVWQEKHRRDI